MAASFSDDEEYTIPLKDKRVFGAGIKRKRVHFVPATHDGDEAVPTSTANRRALLGTRESAAERYLRIVLKGEEEKKKIDREREAEPQNLEPKALLASKGRGKIAEGSLHSINRTLSNIPSKVMTKAGAQHHLSESDHHPLTPSPTTATTNTEHAESEYEHSLASPDHSLDALNSSPPPMCPI